MSARNGQHGYGWVTRALHWLTVALLLAQFTVGYLIDDGGSGRGRGRGRGGDGSGQGRGRGRGGEEDALDLLPLHVALGITILVIAIVRVYWRLSTPLPPWQESLSVTEQRLATWTERVMLGLLFVIPASGLWLRFGEDDVLAVHVAAHLAFFAALAAHLALVLGRGLAGRPVLLRRMV